MSDLADTIARCHCHIGLLMEFAPNARWKDAPLYRKWESWRTRQYLTNSEYRRLENYLNRCCDRALYLHQQERLCHPPK